MNYKSFSTTKNKLSKTLDGLKEVQKLVVDLAEINIKFKSKNYLSNQNVFLIAENLQTNGDSLELEITFENLEENFASSLNFVPITYSRIYSGFYDLDFYGTLNPDADNYAQIYFDQTWEKRGTKFVVALYLYTDIEFDNNSLPTFTNLYLTIINDKRFYNV